MTEEEETFAFHSLYNKIHGLETFGGSTSPQLPALFLEPAGLGVSSGGVQRQEGRGIASRFWPPAMGGHGCPDDNPAVKHRA